MDIPQEVNRPKIVAVDFDGTLYKNGRLNITLAINLIKFREAGNEVILWTCRENVDLLNPAIAMCNELGLYFNAVNCNSPTGIEINGGDTRKPYADVYIDDKGVTAETFLMVIDSL